MKKYQRQIGDPKRDYGKEWKRWRLEHKMSQEQIALASGIARRSIQRIEAGEIRPHSRTRIKFKALQNRYAQEKKCPPLNLSQLRKSSKASPSECPPTQPLSPETP